MRYIGGTLKQRRRVGVGAKVQWRKDRGAWYLVVHTQRDRAVRRFGPTLADKRRAEKAADEINHRLALGEYEARKPEREAIPFGRFARDWVRREIEIPLDRGMEGQLAAGTARSYSMHVRVHLIPYFCQRDLRSIKVPEVQSFVDHCVETGRPRSKRTIELVLATLRLILSHARALGHVEVNAVEAWKAGQRGKGRRRSIAAKQVDEDKVLSFEELHDLLRAARSEWPDYHVFILFLADTGARLGEATALRWLDVDLEAGSARIARSFSSGMYLGPTKTGRVRTVELSRRVREALAAVRPDLFPDEALVFANEAGGFIDPGNFRQRVWDRLVRKALGQGRKVTPHALRHTFASLHMARGTNLKWIQEQGGWTSATLLLDTYGHFMPTETRGFADILSASPDGTRRHQADGLLRGQGRIGAKTRAPSRTSVVAQGGIEPPTRGFSVRCSTN